MVFRSFIGVLKNIFSKRKDFSVFEQRLLSDAGPGIYRGPIGGFQGRRRGFPLCRSNKHPIKTLSEPSPDPFPKPGEFSKKRNLSFSTPMKLRKTGFSQAYICNGRSGLLSGVYAKGACYTKSACYFLSLISRPFGISFYDPV